MVQPNTNKSIGEQIEELLKSCGAKRVGDSYQWNGRCYASFMELKGAVQNPALVSGEELPVEPEIQATRKPKSVVGPAEFVIAVIVVIGGILLKTSGQNEATDARVQPKTANDCQVEHMKRVEGIRAFSSGESMERQLNESVKTWQSCGEQALQDRIKK